MRRSPGWLRHNPRGIGTEVGSRLFRPSGRGSSCIQRAARSRLHLMERVADLILLQPFPFCQGDFSPISTFRWKVASWTASSRSLFTPRIVSHVSILRDNFRSCQGIFSSGEGGTGRVRGGWAGAAGRVRHRNDGRSGLFGRMP